MAIRFSLVNISRLSKQVHTYKDKFRISLYLLFSQPDMSIENPLPPTPATLPALDDLSQTQKDELLLKLLSVEESRKEKMKGYCAKYQKKRRHNDEEFRQKLCKRSSEYSKQKYEEDAEFREKARARALASYYRRKGLTIDKKTH